MAEAIGLVASAMTVAELATKAAKLCYGYSNAVKRARKYIRRIRQRLENLSITLRGFQRLAEKEPSLETSRRLASSLGDCSNELHRLSRKIRPGAGRTTMSRFGFRALAWPLKSKEVDKIVCHLDDYQRTFNHGLQIDQTEILLDIRQQVGSFPRNQDLPTTSTSRAYFHTAFSQNPDFVDRPDIMTWMKEQFEGPHKRMALRGLGGFGKSQLANYFAHKVNADSPQTNIFWINASTEARLLESYRSIADVLEIPGRSDAEANVFALVQSRLENSEAEWLMVLDSADDINVFYPAFRTRHGQRTQEKPVASFLPKKANGNILITTRSLDVAEKLTGNHKSIFHVSTMDVGQSSRLFLNKLKFDLDEENKAVIPDLVHSLGYIPLAISQAAAYISRRAPLVSPCSYRELFNKSENSKRSLLNQDAGDLQRDDSVSNSVVVTWQVTFDQIRGESPKAAFLLSFLSFFNPQGIPVFALRNIKLSFEANGDYNAEAAGSESVFDDAIDILRGYSLVSILGKGDFIELHPLVQSCTQFWMSSNGEKKKFERAYLKAMANKFHRLLDKNIFQCHQLIPHIEWVLEKSPIENTLRSWLRVSNDCAYYYYRIGCYAAAESLASRNIKVSRGPLQRDPKELVKALQIYSSALAAEDQKEKAAEVGLRAFNISRQELGDQHPLTAVVATNLASLYSKLGRTRGAEEVTKSSAEIVQETQGVGHTATLGAWTSLGEIYQQQERTEDAINLIESALRNHESTSTSGRSANARAVALLGQLLREQGKYKASEEKLKHALGEYRELYGDDHNNTISTMLKLSDTLEAQGRLRAAIALCRAAVESNKRVFGPHHSYTNNAREEVDRLQKKMRRPSRT